MLQHIKDYTQKNINFLWIGLFSFFLWYSIKYLLAVTVCKTPVRTPNVVKNTFLLIPETRLNNLLEKYLLFSSVGREQARQPACPSFTYVTRTRARIRHAFTLSPDNASVFCAGPASSGWRLRTEDINSRSSNAFLFLLPSSCVVRV